MKILFMGTPQFAVPALERCVEEHDVVGVFCQPDKRSGRGKKLAAPPVKSRAVELGIPVFQPSSVRNEEVIENARALNADVAVVVAYGKILPESFLNVFEYGCLNIHGSLLPAYRGAAPIQWAVMNGERTTGVSIMQLDVGMDTGPVFDRESVSIQPGETAGDLFERLAPIGATRLSKVLGELSAGTACAEPQDTMGVSHARMLTKRDGNIDWSKPSDVVASLICGADPWPVARASWRGEPIRFFRATSSDQSGAPGEVIEVTPDGVVVACGEGACLIREAQAAGKKRMAASVFARGASVGPGDVFGIL